MLPHFLFLLVLLEEMYNQIAVSEDMYSYKNFRLIFGCFHECVEYPSLYLLLAYFNCPPTAIFTSNISIHWITAIIIANLFPRFPFGTAMTMRTLYDENETFASLSFLLS